MSPQSQSVFNTLLDGRTVSSGKITTSALDIAGMRLLQTMIKNRDALESCRGDSRIETLLSMFNDQKADETESLSHVDTESENQDSRSIQHMDSDVEITSLPPKKYRLHQIECTSFRGLAPAGNKIEFDFAGISNLIYGPNGSGKSSLLGAVCWVLNGEFVPDGQTQNSQTKVFKKSKPGEGLVAIREWSPEITLPDSQITKQTVHDCLVQITLIDDDGKRLHLKRSFIGGLETSRDGTSWTSKQTLAELGINALDLELSLNAPVELSRLTVEQAQSVPDILAKLLGLSDVQRIGKLATDIGRNRTTRRNWLKDEIETTWEEIRTKLEASTAYFEDQEKVPAALTKTLSLQHPSTDELKVAGETLAKEHQAAESELATLVGVQSNVKTPSQGNLSDDLLKAISELQKNDSDIFPKFNAIQLDNALAATEEQTSSVILESIRKYFSDFLSTARARIKARYEWWQRENENSGRSSLLLHAAEYFLAEENSCPVCYEEIKDDKLRKELIELKKSDQELRENLESFFRSLKAELDKLVPASLRSVCSQSPAARLSADWQKLKKVTLPAALKPVYEKYDADVTAIISEITIAPVDSPIILPADCEERFQQTAEDFHSVVDAANESLRLLDWSSREYESILSRLNRSIKAENSQEGKSLYETLAAGREKADAIKPLKQTLAVLRTAYKDRDKLQKLLDELNQLSQLEKPLAQLKVLTKYSDNEINTTFSRISEQTMAYWKLLYPETGTGLEPHSLAIGKKKNERIQAYLANEHCIALEAFFANTGLQRAVALSLFFALLEEHPAGLGFVIMDDPMTSLDDDHREGWSSKILKEKMLKKQYIVSTHQLHYFANCQDDFSGNAVVELNSRPWPRAISFRPGSRIADASNKMLDDWRVVPNILRKYCEYALHTLETYSNKPFYDHSNLSATIARYKSTGEDNPLYSDLINEMSDILTDNGGFNFEMHGLMEKE
ncbi:AAA family ATPase [Rubinisphaera italica]|uniref:AAA family ATPase n=1 Tax=Rubinisphaera italica TaxID=2527969 RepID=UPI001A953B8A|nr:AAA family ATPase [Rubinisphaera italica]